MASQNALREQLPEKQGLSKEEFRELVKAEIKFKARSHETYHNVHLPELKNQQTESTDRTLNAVPIDSSATGHSQTAAKMLITNIPAPINTVLIGDSMLERLKTTGVHTSVAKLPSSFNAGVGGDKIENVLYRLDLGMMELLEDRSVKVWVVMVGTNNLKKTLKLVEIERYRLLLRALLRISPTSLIVVCALFKRKDIDDQYVDESNRLLFGLVGDINKNIGSRIHWLESPLGVTKENLVDHVHLDEEGYRIWDMALYPKVQELLANTERIDPDSNIEVSRMGKLGADQD